MNVPQAGSGTEGSGTHKQKDNHEQPEVDGPTADRRSQLRLTRWMTYATVVLALVAIGQVFLLWQANATSVAAINLARENSMREQRAYVQIRIAEISVLNDGWLVQVRWANSGKTPAYDVSLSINKKLIDMPKDGPLGDPPAPSARSEYAGKGTIGNDSPFQHSFHISLSPRQKIALEAGDEILVVWGHVTYRDAFNVPHKSDFHLFSSSVLSADAPRLLIAPKGNDAN